MFSVNYIQDITLGEDGVELAKMPGVRERLQRIIAPRTVDEIADAAANRPVLARPERSANGTSRGRGRGRDRRALDRRRANRCH